MYFNFLFLQTADPKFSAPIINATVAVGRDAILSCQVHDLIQYKVKLVFDIKRNSFSTPLTRSHKLSKSFKSNV